MIFNLSHLGLISVTGADADKFLQGQCTNDIRQLTEQKSQLGSHCNHKGRMLAIFRLFRYGKAIYLQVPQSILPILLERLTKYRLRDRVDLCDVSDQMGVLGVAGEATISMLDAAVAAINAEVCVTVIPGLVPRMQILGKLSQLQELQIRLVELGAMVSDDNKWKLFDIQAGIPTLYPATMDAFVPQMTNLQLLGGVSFNKGCYVGQEVVARLQHLGSLKRQLFRAEVVTARCPQPGEMLFAESSNSGQGTGKILEVGLIKDNLFELLAVVEIEAVTQGIVCIGDSSGPQLRFLDLP